MHDCCTSTYVSVCACTFEMPARVDSVPCLYQTLQAGPAAVAAAQVPASSRLSPVRLLAAELFCFSVYEVSAFAFVAPLLQDSQPCISIPLML